MRELISSAGFGHLDEFDFVTFGSIDEGNTAAVGFKMRAIRVLEAEFGEVFGEILEAIHFESKVSEVGLDLDRAASGEVAKLDQLLTLGGLEKHKF